MFAIVCDIKSMMAMMMIEILMMVMAMLLMLQMVMGSSNWLESASHPSLLCRDAIGFL